MTADSRRGSFILLVFLAARIPLLFLRQPFYDELFTRWLAGRSFGAILDALRLDSGPPLYYWLMRLAGDPPLLVMRALSLLFATAALAVILNASRLGTSRFAAAMILALFPPAVLFSVDARAYALCAMFVAFGGVALVYEQPYAAAAMFVLAGYSHYYGALFLVLLIPHVRALLAAAVLYAPAVWLAFHQPRESMGWVSRWQYPDALFIRPPLLLLAVAIVALLLAVIKPRREALWTLVPLALAMIGGVYVPLRFEAVIAVPLAVWLAASGRRVLLVAFGAACAVWTILGIVEHATRPPDEYRDAAAWLARHAQPGETVVASGYLYLETIAQRPAVAFPPEQAEHPGWRAVARTGSGLPAGAFLWIGERNAPELNQVLHARRADPLYINSRAVVLKVH